ncbi:MAG TPA: thiamine pyrophosphate-dependent enzyme [Anaeromyxobacteraceae bacterium]|nr:thiamine pyrophosphate-dependent enzyme [Anaeromyxobacteraceae bacterium]
MRREAEVARRRGHDGRDESAEEPGAPDSRFEREFPLLQILGEDGIADPSQPLLADAEVKRIFRAMLLNRELDRRMVALQRQGRIGFYIGAAGEEASVYGAVAAMEDRDWIFPCYREHGAALWRGMPLSTFMCDLFGNAGDLMQGHQMPCHEAWRPGRYLSISSPIATQIPQAVGAAWAARIRNQDEVALTWFGEGATSASDFHTGLNFAGVRKAPVVLVCRNNGWAISVPRERQTASETIAQKALAYGIRGERVDGNDLLAVHAAARRARARAAAGEGPTLIECVTYRMEGHSTSDDPKAYRPPELLEPWKRKDPIRRVRLHLKARGVLTGEDEARLEAEVKEEVKKALAEAEAFDRKPPLETLFDNVYARPLWQQEEQLQEIREALAGDPRVAGDR